MEHFGTTKGQQEITRIELQKPGSNNQHFGLLHQTRFIGKLNQLSRSKEPLGFS